MHPKSFVSNFWGAVHTRAEVFFVCGGANESCPTFRGDIKHRLHIGFDDPSDAVGTENFITEEFRRVRDEIKDQFYQLYITRIASDRDTD